MINELNLTLILSCLITRIKPNINFKNRMIKKYNKYPSQIPVHI